MTTTYNVNIIGSLTNNNGILSGFSTSNYATTTTEFKPGSSPWELNFKITTGADVNTSQAVFWKATSHWYGVVVTVWNGKIYTAVSSGVEAVIVDAPTNTSISPNTTYYIKVQFTGSAYNLYLSTDGVNYNLEINQSSSTPMVDFSGDCKLGLHDSAVGRPFLGTIDLSGCNFKVNSQLIWEGETNTLDNIPKIGSVDIQKVYLGSQEVSKIYLGNNLVYG